MAMNSRKARANEVVRKLSTGPASLAERSPFTPGGDAGEKARAQLLNEYKLWLQTWILPELEVLIPELRMSAAARRAAAAIGRIE